MSRWFAALALAFILLPGDGIAQSTPEAVRERGRAFMDAFNKGDASSIAQLYTETATVMPPDRPTVKGREGIQKFWDAVFKAGTTNLVITPMDLWINGKEATEVADLTVTLSGDKPTAGRHILIWRQDGDGLWRINYDIWNFSAPRQ